MAASPTEHRPTPTDSRSPASSPSTASRPTAMQPAYGQQPYSAPSPYGDQYGQQPAYGQQPGYPRSTASRPATASTARPRCRPAAARHHGRGPRLHLRGARRARLAVRDHRRRGGHRCGGQRRRGVPGPRRARRRRGRGADRLRTARPRVDRGHDLGLGVGPDRPQPRDAAGRRARSPSAFTLIGFFGSVGDNNSTGGGIVFSLLFLLAALAIVVLLCLRPAAASSPPTGPAAAPERSSGPRPARRARRIRIDIGDLPTRGVITSYTPPPTRRLRRPAQEEAAPCPAPPQVPTRTTRRGVLRRGSPAGARHQSPGPGYSPAPSYSAARRYGAPASARHGDRRRHHRHRLGSPRPPVRAAQRSRLVFALSAPCSAPGARVGRRCRQPCSGPASR